MTIVESRVKQGSLVVGGEAFSCQPTSAAIEPANDTAGGDDAVEVLCGDTLSAASGATLTANLTLTAIQDFTAPDGTESLVGYSWAHNSETVDFTWNPTADPVDEWVGKVTVQALNIGGDVNTRITTEASWPITELTMPTRLGGKKVIGSATAATGVTAGTPGAFVPPDAIPGSLTTLKADPVIGDAGTSKPGATWTTGQYVVLGDASQAHWNGTAWATGAHALVADDDE
jgi:hypothetical protein